MSKEFEDLEVVEMGFYVNRETSRDVYKYNGVQITHDNIIPGSLEPSRDVVYVDVVCDKTNCSSDIKYSEVQYLFENSKYEGLFLPWFDSMVKAKAFIDTLDKNIYKIDWM